MEWNEFKEKLERIEREQLQVVINSATIEVIFFLSKQGDSVVYEVIDKNSITQFNTLTNSNSITTKRSSFKKNILSEKVCLGIEQNQIPFAIRYTSENDKKNIIFVDRDAVGALCIQLGIKSLNYFSRIDLTYLEYIMVRKNTLLNCTIENYQNGNYVLSTVAGKTSLTRLIEISQLQNFENKLPKFKFVNGNITDKLISMYFEFPELRKQGIVTGLWFQKSRVNRGNYLFVTAANEGNNPNKMPVYLKEIGKTLDDFEKQNVTDTFNEIRFFDNEKMTFSLFDEKMDSISGKTVIGTRKYKNLSKGFPQTGTELELIKSFIDIPTTLGTINEVSDVTLRLSLGQWLLRNDSSNSNKSKKK